MLFLLNDRVLDLRDPAETLVTTGLGNPLRLPTSRRIIAMGQDAAFAAPNFEHAHPDLGVALACQIALTSEANCALFVRPPRARSPRDVGVQFAYAPLMTMAFLQDAETRGQLTPGLINAHVWNLARAAASA